MRIIRANRGGGKTTELVKESNREWKYIVCKDQQRLDIIMETANHLGLDIPFPITVRELPISRGSFIKSVLIDDLEDILPMFIGRHIDIATTSCEIKDLSRIVTQKHKFK